MPRSLTSLLLFALASAALVACGDDSSSSGSGGGGGGAAVACEEAVDGDPCAASGDSCGAIECYGCFTRCDEGVWNVECTEQPACDPNPVGWGTTCNSYCGPLDCGPYEVESTCGVETLAAECGIFGWAYTGSACLPDCRAAADADSCGALLDCVWLVPCEGSDDMAPRCASLAAEPAEGGMIQKLCDDQPCPVDQVCVQLGVNPNDLTSGDCSGSGSIATVCEAQLPPE